MRQGSPPVTASDCPSGENRTAEMRSERPTSRATRSPLSAAHSSTSWNPATGALGELRHDVFAAGLRRLMAALAMGLKERPDLLGIAALLRAGSVSDRRMVGAGDGGNERHEGERGGAAAGDPRLHIKSPS